MSMFTIKVPASSANIGAGFDSIGLAVNRYLTLHVTEQDEWEFVHHSSLLPEIEDHQDHLIYQIAQKIASHHKANLPPCKVEVESDIPLARGLGSSSSAVIAGIELANKQCGLSLTTEEKLQYAIKLEGHPDNVAPALLGGLIIGATTEEDHVDSIRIEHLDLDIIVYIPDIELKTDDARNALPAVFSRDYAVAASGISNVMVAALLTHDYKLAGEMMEKDLFHEPFRKKLIPNYDRIKQLTKEYGAYGTVISGAGPTTISFAPAGKGDQIAIKMKEKFPDYQVSVLQIDTKGLHVQ